MNIGVFLGIGESFEQMFKSGQKDRFIEYYLSAYSKDFGKVYIFSYEAEILKISKKVIVVPNKFHIHRYIYAIFIPIIYRKYIKDCHVVRGFGLTSALSSLLLTKPFVFNWAYDYTQFLLVDKKYILIPAFKLLEALAFLRANKVLIATKSKLNKLKGSKYVYSPNGVDLKRLSPKKTNGKGLVFVGRFEKQKNLFFLLDSVSLLPTKLRSITFIGSGSQKKTLKRYAAKRKVKLTIIPPMPNSDLPKLLNRFSIFTLPSFAEGVPKVLLEAMALGLVPVVTEFATAKEVIKDGFDGCITPFDKKFYAQRIKILFEDHKMRKQISQNAKLKIKDRFNLQKVITKEIEVLKEVAI